MMGGRTDGIGACARPVLARTRQGPFSGWQQHAAASIHCESQPPPPGCGTGDRELLVKFRLFFLDEIVEFIWKILSLDYKKI
jgi:hypothetical protein